MKVRVYRNLRNKCYSVVSVKTGRVIAHEKFVALIDARFSVRESGRQRVLREKRKNVHAFVTGFVAQSKDVPAATKKPGFQVYYNPYKTKTFINKRTKKPVMEADLVMLGDKGIVAWNV